MAMKACAYVVGPRDGPGAALRDMASTLGFETVLPFSTIAAAEQQAAQTPLLFFLFAAVDDPLTLKPVADALRLSPGRRIRFSPLIYFSESPSLAAIKCCAGMGFDDVITLPFLLARVEERLARQVDRTQIYFESASYFGPDRRTSSATRTLPPARGKHRRLEIIRTTTEGTSVLRDDLHAPT
ncbi:MAG: hypothetical protein GX548_04475 [Lentisphaerae bacterium]|nr:hypothetical protein [Lentisphaerota bacterium]